MAQMLQTPGSMLNAKVHSEIKWTSMVGERVIIYSHKLEDQGTLQSPVDCDQHILESYVRPSAQ